MQFQDVYHQALLVQAALSSAAATKELFGDLIISSSLLFLLGAFVRDQLAVLSFLLSLSPLSLFGVL